MPSLRQTSSIGVPDSASFSAKSIGQSVNLDFFTGVVSKEMPPRV
jgi:hypothetical protein